MAIIKKYAEVLTQPLSSYVTFVNDDAPNSTYFRITEFKDTFTGGKNGFLIEGSEHLKETTEIKLQILDVEGNPVYYEPGNGIPEYYEGNSKIVAVYVYENTPIGLGKITVLGELKTYIDENGIVRDIPENWAGVYNCKWERTFTINKLLSNEDKVRFYKRPKVVIEEIVKPIFSNIVTAVTQTGTVDGFAQTPASGEKLAGFTLPTNYLLQINNNATAWTGSIVGSTINLTNLGFSSVVDDVISNKDITITTPYTENGIVKDISNQPYSITFNYVEGIDNLKTALTGSFAKINLRDLTTFVGDVARVKIFRKSQSDLADYQFIQEIQLESNEILTDLESTVKNLENYGTFDEVLYPNYWLTSSNNITTEFNQDFLYSSIKLNSNGTNQFFTSKSLSLTTDTEYTLGFNIRLAQNISSDNYVKVYLSGSRQTTYNNVTSTIGVRKDIVTITSDNSVLQKSQLSSNFKADEINNAKLYFEVKGNGWYVSDVSLRASQETSYSPDEITFIQPIPRTLPAETFNFLFQFYDINNNYIPVIVEASKTFDGGNLNPIQKSLELIPSSLYFQFDSGSGNGNPLPPTVITFDVIKNYLTGSVTFTSRSFDFFNNELSSSQYSYTVTPGYNWYQFPGLLNDLNTDSPYLTVQNFTGSRDPQLEDIVVQFIEYTAECEGVEDSVIITRVIDGKGGVNYEIRPYNGTVIRNSNPSSSLEVQSIRIDGVNEINLRSGLPAGRSAVQLHVQSGSTYITLQDASNKNFVKGLSAGVTGSGELNYNAVFKRESIDGQRTLYLIPSGSTNLSASILTTLTLTDLLDGIDAGVVLFDADTFTINPRLTNTFTPISSSATASFYKRGTTEGPISASIEVFPSMSINSDFVPEYWMYYVTNSVNPEISVIAYDEKGFVIPSTPYNQFIGLPTTQSKQLLVNFTYTEEFTSASVSVDKLFTIVPEGKPGDESIVFEVVPSSVTLQANSRGFVTDYSPTITDVKLKQGSRYLIFTSSREPGTFHIATGSIIGNNITAGNVYFDNLYTQSLILSASSNMTDLSASIELPLEIQPYYTSSIYTASVFQNITKVLDGAPPIEIVISPLSANISADEVGYVSDYANARTTIRVREGSDYLTFTTSSTSPGSWRVQYISGSNIQTASLQGLLTSSTDTAVANFQRFDFPHVSASAVYGIRVYPYALGAGHQYTSSLYERTQLFTKNVAQPAARSVTLTSTSETVNFDGDGVVVTPEGDITLTATAFNMTGSAFYQFYKDSVQYSSIQSTNTFTISSGDATSPGQIATWRVDVRDGSNSASATVRAQAQITISGIKAGAEAYAVNVTNEVASLVGDVWELNTTGSNTQIVTIKGSEQLTHVNSFSAPTLDLNGDPIGSLGEYQVTIQSKPNYITLPGGLVSGSIVPTVGGIATIGDVVSWNQWGNNTNAEIVYKINIEGGRQILYKTQSLSIQFNPYGPYSGQLSNENSSVVYKVSGEIELQNTGNTIRGFRGDTELVNSSSFTNPQTDAFGNTGYKNQYNVSIHNVSANLDLAGALVSGSYLTGNPASIAQLDSWGSPESIAVAQIVYRIDCEGRENLYKTQSLSIQYEGNTGPGIVMRGLWNEVTDYIGSVETTNYRRDAIIFPDPSGSSGATHYWAALSGSGPAGVGPQLPTSPTSPSYVDTSYWQYLGEQDFFVSAKIAIFEESFVKNTINVGNNPGSAFANVVIAGGRTDPYISIGQNGTVGASGDQTSNGVIGYDRGGIFLGVYEGGATTSGRFSIKTQPGGASTAGLLWDGDTLTIIGAIRQTTPGVPEGEFRGAWVGSPATQYYVDDTVTFNGASYICTVAHTSTNGTGNTGYPDQSIYWMVYAASGTSGVNGAPGANGTSGTSGAAGSVGPGVVFRGPFSTGSVYFKSSTRTDVVQQAAGGSNYWLASNAALNNQSGSSWGVPSPSSSNWTSFGAEFSSIATGTIISEQSYVQSVLNVGTNTAGSTANIAIVGGTQQPYISIGQGTQGYGRPGVFLGNDANNYRLSLVNNEPTASAAYRYLRWSGTGLELRGSVEALDGVIGSWKIIGNTIQSENDSILLDAADESITVFDSNDTLRFQANTDTSLPSISAATSGNSSFSSSAFFSDTTINASDDVFAEERYYWCQSNFTTGAAGKYLIKYIYNPSTLPTFASAEGFAYSSVTYTIVVAPLSGGNPDVNNAYFGNSAGAYAYGSMEEDNFRSVIGDTEILMSDGSTKLAKDIEKWDEILAWDNELKQFVSAKISNVSYREVSETYKVKIGSYELEVSDTHTFWVDGEVDELSVLELVPGKSKINVKVGDIIEQKVVDSIEVIDGGNEVYSFSVPKYLNYVSNNIISHNVIYTAVYDIDYLPKPLTFVVSPSLAASTSYRIGLKTTHTLESLDTGGSPYFATSRATAQANIGTSTSVSYQLVSAGTIANGGGFQTVTTSTAYLRHDATISSYPTDNYNSYKGGFTGDTLRLRKDSGDSDTILTIQNIGTSGAFTAINVVSGAGTVAFNGNRVTLGGAGTFASDGAIRVGNSSAIYFVSPLTDGSVGGQTYRDVRMSISAGTYEWRMFRDGPSSRRYKKEIEDWNSYPDLLDKIEKVRVKEFRYIEADPNSEYPKKLSLIAEDLYDAGLTDLIGYSDVTGSNGEVIGQQPEDLDNRNILWAVWGGINALISKVKQMESQMSSSLGL
jgi:hypothetical protein